MFKITIENLLYNTENSYSVLLVTRMEGNPKRGGSL